MTPEQIARTLKFADILPTFTQTNGTLKITRFDGTACYCCLGVACEFFRQETGIGKWDDAPNQSSTFNVNGTMSRSYLPPSVQLWFGWDNTLWLPSLGASAVQANDNDGRTFAEIAAGFRTLTEVK